MNGKVKGYNGIATVDILFGKSGRCSIDNIRLTVPYVAVASFLVVDASIGVVDGKV